jgi:hypothetical protein
MDPNVFKEMFFAHLEKCAMRYFTNFQKKYTVRSMKINGVTILNMPPFVANNSYEFFAKFRAKVREVSNMELFNYELAMDIIDEYVEHELERSRPDTRISLENIIDAYIDAVQHPHQYDLKLHIESGTGTDTDTESDTDTDTDTESDTDTETDSDDDFAT